MRMIAYRKLYNRWEFRFHTQNLKKEEGGGLIHSRGWMNFGDFEFGWSYNIPRIAFGFHLDVGRGDDDGSLYIAIPGISIWFHIELPRPWRWLYDERRTGFDVHSGSFWWRLWVDENDYPRRRSGTWHFTDWLLGRHKYKEEMISPETPTKVEMPEGTYDATVKIFKSTWKRPRWFAKSIVRAEISVPAGIPFSGKGENSWDCGDDALFGSTFACDNMLDAVEHIRHEALKYRKRYGDASAVAYEKRGMQCPRVSNVS
jgi:hypothetical protein